MTPSSPHIVIVAGEASGDMHAAHLVTALKHIHPRLTFSGLGGQKMKDSGVEIYDDLTRLAVIGFIEVVKHYRAIKKAFDLILARISEIHPAAVILVDYPGFNLRLAKKIKERHPDIKVIYYISPQVWAWKENRVHAIRRCVDKMLVLFRFEKDFYARYAMDVDFVGHPLIDQIHAANLPTISPNVHAWSRTIGILPGSREKEIERILPVMLDAANILYRTDPQLKFVLPKAPTISLSLLEKFTSSVSLPLTITPGNTYAAIASCDVCMVTSGTATLETAILNKPMVVVYKTSWLTWLMARLLIKIPCIGLVNVVAGKKIVPECIQFEATGERIAAELKAMYLNPEKMQSIKTELTNVRDSLGEPGAGRRAAEAIGKML